jgi:hypothetical protein
LILCKKGEVCTCNIVRTSVLLTLSFATYNRALLLATTFIWHCNGNFYIRSPKSVDSCVFLVYLLVAEEGLFFPPLVWGFCCQKLLFVFILTSPYTRDFYIGRLPKYVDYFLLRWANSKWINSKTKTWIWEAPTTN